MIIHLARKAHGIQKNANPHEYYGVDYELTRMLLLLFLYSDTKGLFLWAL